MTMNDLDWIEAVSGPLRQSVVETLQRLPLAQIKTQPGNRDQGVPFGFEPHILARHVRGLSCQFEHSGFARAYRYRLSPRERRLHEGLVLRRPLPESAWIDLLGQEATDRWLEHGLLLGENRGTKAGFYIRHVGDAVLVADSHDTRFPLRVHIGGDSVRMVEFLQPRLRHSYGRVLDVGTGSGVILLNVGLGASPRELVGLDINPRAVALTAVNAELNRQTCRTVEHDVLDPNTDVGRFDLVTWNTPFRFFPDDFQRSNLDGYGGRMGIEIGLRFVERLPDLLTDRGHAFAMTQGPVMKNGDRVLDAELEALARKLGLDVSLSILYTAWDTPLRDFHERHGIDRFESSVAEVRPGRGTFERHEEPLGARARDGVRWALHRARSAGVLYSPTRPPNVEQ